MKQELETFCFERKINEQGYVLIRIEDRFVLEHKWVLEQFLGRKLTKEEVCHHLNTDRIDNRIENLMLFPNQKEHSKFHRKLQQHGLTTSMAFQILNRWENLNIHLNLNNVKC